MLFSTPYHYSFQASATEQVGDGGGEIFNTTTTTAAELDAGTVISGTVETVNEEL